MPTFSARVYRRRHHAPQPPISSGQVWGPRERIPRRAGYDDPARLRGSAEEGDAALLQLLLLKLEFLLIQLLQLLLVRRVRNLHLLHLLRILILLLRLRQLQLLILPVQIVQLVRLRAFHQRNLLLKIILLTPQTRLHLI